MNERIFVSYNRQDAAFALKLADDLAARDINVWIDQRNIAPGLRWDQEVEKALSAAEVVLVILSPQSVASDNVLDEVSFAIEAKKRIIPVIAEKCTIPFRLNRFQHIEFKQDYSGGLNRLLKVIMSETTDVPGGNGKGSGNNPKTPSWVYYGLIALAVLIVGALFIKFCGSGPKGDTNIGGGVVPTDTIKATQDCQPENVDFANGNTTVFQADFTALAKLSNEYGNVQPSQSGNIYEMEAFSNTWVGLPAPDYYIKVNNPLSDGFIVDLWFKIVQGEPSIHLTLSDDGENYSNYNLYLEIWGGNNPTYSADEGWIKNNFYSSVKKQFAERARIPDCIVSKINWKVINHIVVKRENEALKFYLNNYLLQSFPASVFPIKKVAIAIAGKSKIEITALEAKIPH